MLKNLPSPRYSFPQNSSPRLTSQSIRPNPRPTQFPSTNPPASKVRNEVIASSDIKPIPLRERTSKLLISQQSIQICIDEINKRKRVADPPLNLIESALELVQTEVTYKLFYLLRV